MPDTSRSVPTLLFLFSLNTYNSVLFPKSLNSRTRQGVDRNPLAIGRNRSSSGAQCQESFSSSFLFLHPHARVCCPPPRSLSPTTLLHLLLCLFLFVLFYFFKIKFNNLFVSFFRKREMKFFHAIQR